MKIKHQNLSLFVLTRQFLWCGPWLRLCAGARDDAHGEEGVRGDALVRTGGCLHTGGCVLTGARDEDTFVTKHTHMATLKCKVGFQVQPHVGQLTAQYKGRTIFGKGKVIIKCHAGQKWWVDMRLFLFVRLISSRQVLSCSYRVDRSSISFIKCFKFNLKINPSVPHTYINHGHNPYICTIK